MKRLAINRWVYMTIVAIVCIAIAILVGEYTGEESVAMTLARLALLLALPALTFPMGLIGAVSVLALIYSGIVTPFEAYFLSMPIFVISGWLQWYVVLPKIYKARLNIATINTKGDSGSAALNHPLPPRSALEGETLTSHTNDESPPIVPKRSIAVMCVTVAGICASGTYMNIRDGAGIALVFRPLALSLALLSTPFVFAMFAAFVVDKFKQGQFKQTFWLVIKICSLLISAAILLFGSILVLNHLATWIALRHD